MTAWAYHVGPILIALLPLVEVVGFSLYWRSVLTSPWLYGVVGTVVVYAIAVSSLVVADKVGSKTGLVYGYTLQKLEPRAPGVIPSAIPDQPTIDRGKVVLSLLVIGILAVCAGILWGMKHLFARAAP